jgi:hypothetical protein
MSIQIKTDLVFRTKQNTKLTIANADENLALVSAQVQSTTNTLMYIGPTPSNTGWTISNTSLSNPRSSTFNARITPSGFNPIGASPYLVNGATFTFKFSGTSSGNLGSQSLTYDWWANLNSNYSNKIFTLSEVNTPANSWDYKIHAISYTSSIWQVTTTQLSGPTNSSLSGNRLYTVGHRTVQPPNTSLTYGWSASIPMAGRNFPLTIGTMSPNVIYNSNYLVRVTSASVQFIGVTGVGEQVNPLFGINLNADLDVDSYTETLATATFSGTYSQNRTYRLRPTNLMMDGDSVLYLTGTTYSAWSGINFVNSPTSRIAIFLTYTLFQKADTGLETIE